MGAVLRIVQWLVVGVAGYGGLKFAETTLGPSPVTVNTNGGGVVESISEKLGIKQAFVWIGIVALAVFLLRQFFPKSKSL